MMIDKRTGRVEAEDPEKALARLEALWDGLHPFPLDWNGTCGSCPAGGVPLRWTRAVGGDIYICKACFLKRKGK